MKYKVAAVQFAPESLKTEENLRRMADLTREAKSMGASLVVFPELSDAGWVHWPASRSELRHASVYFEAANPIPGPASDFLSRVARDNEVGIVAGLLEADPLVRGRIYDSAVMIDSQGKLVGRYTKVNSPLAEMFYFVRGHRLDVFDTQFGRVGMSICYDVMFPETMRVQVLRGMEVACWISNAALPDPSEFYPDSPIPMSYPRHLFKERANIRAYENCTYVICCNRVGKDEFSGANFHGDSCIVAPWGDPLAQAEADEETILVAEIDLDLISALRACHPFLKDRRPDLYGIIDEMH